MCAKQMPALSLAVVTLSLLLAGQYAAATASQDSPDKHRNSTSAQGSIHIDKKNHYNFYEKTKGFPWMDKHHRTKRSDSNPYAGVELQDAAIKIRQAFIKDLHKGPIDLVILVERTRAVGRFFFNGYVKNMLNHTLRYNTDVRPSAVRIAVTTFAKSVRLHVNGLKEDLAKCQLWNEETYMDDILLDGLEGDWNHGDFGEAYQSALEIFTSAKKLKKKKYLWVISSGEVIVQNGDPDGVKEELVNMGVIIVGVITGIAQQAHIATFRNILSTTHHLMGNVTQFALDLPSPSPLTFHPANISDTCGTLSKNNCYYDTVFGYEVCGIPTCTSRSCAPGDRCVRRDLTSTDLHLCGHLYLHDRCKYSGRRYQVCTCWWLSSEAGPACQLREEDCVRHACANGGACTVSGENNYNCTCLHNYTGQYCEELGPQPKEEDKGVDPRVIVGAAAGGGGALLVLVGAGCCICIRRRRRARNAAVEPEPEPEPQPTHVSIGTSTEPMSVAHRLYATLRGLPTVMVKPKRKAPPVPPKPPPKPPKLQPLRPVGLPGDKGPTYETVSGDEEEDEDEEKIKTYLNTPLCEGMEEWQSYILELTLHSGATLAEVCVVDKKRRKYVSSSLRILPTPPELATYLTALSSHQVGTMVDIKHKKYSVTENNGTRMKCFEQGGYHGIMCIAKSRRYVVLGYTKKRSREKQVAVEVDFLRNHLEEVGM